MSRETGEDSTGRPLKLGDCVRWRGRELGKIVSFDDRGQPGDRASPGCYLRLGPESPDLLHVYETEIDLVDPSELAILIRNQLQEELLPLLGQTVSPVLCNVIAETAEKVTKSVIERPFLGFVCGTCGGPGGPPNYPAGPCSACGGVSRG